MLRLSRVVVNLWVQSLNIALSPALHGLGNLSCDGLDSLYHFVPHVGVVRADRTLHESFVREDVVGVSRRKVADCEDKVLTAAHVARLDRMEGLVDSVGSADRVTQLVWG